MEKLKKVLIADQRSHIPALEYYANVFQFLSGFFWPADLKIDVYCM